MNGRKQSANARPAFSQRTKDAMQEFGVRSLSDIEEGEIDWIWYPYLARGELTIIEGDPEAGKSFLVQAAVQSLCDGDKLPSKYRSLQPPAGNAVLFDCENDGRTVIKKRLRYMGLENSHRVFIKEDPFSMVNSNIDDIIGSIRGLKPLVVVFDTMNDYFDREANTDKGRDVVHALQPFKKMAKSLGCAVILIRHLTKDTGKKAMYRGQGSISYNGKARIVVAVGTHPDDPDLKVMALTKLSFARKPQALTYKIQDTSTREERDAFDFNWGKSVDMTADDILSVERERGRPSEQRDHAMEFLRSVLEEGPLEVRRIEIKAEKASISRRTLYRAADELRVIKQPQSGGNKRTWSLPK